MPVAMTTTELLEPEGLVTVQHHPHCNTRFGFVTCCAIRFAYCGWWAEFIQEQLYWSSPSPFACIFIFSPILAIDWKIRWEGCFSCTLYLIMCGAFHSSRASVHSYLMQEHAESREGDGCLCVCIHGKTTCLPLHSVLCLMRRLKPVCVL